MNWSGANGCRYANGDRFEGEFEANEDGEKTIKSQGQLYYKNGD